VDDKVKKKNEEKDLSQITCFLFCMRSERALHLTMPQESASCKDNVEEEAGVNAT
jgi:hypothetical protein